MGLVVSTAPTVEPVTLAEAKLHCAVDLSDKDDAITRNIEAARNFAENEINRAIITQTLRWTMDAFPSSNAELIIPRGKLQSVASIQYVDTDGNTQTLDSSKYQVDADDICGRIAPAYGESWPDTRSETFNAVTINYVAGYGLAADVPACIKSAILLIVGHLNENHEQATELALKTLPFNAYHLLSREKVVVV